MTIPQLIVTVDYAKKLKEAGFALDTCWYWHKNIITDAWEINSRQTKDKNDIPAPTDTELGELLPKDIEGSYLICYFMKGKWNVGYTKVGTCDGKTESEARVEMLLHLKEKKLV